MIEGGCVTGTKDCVTGIKGSMTGTEGGTNREFKQIATAGAATAIVVDDVEGEYVGVARQNSTLSNAKYK